MQSLMQREVLVRKAITYKLRKYDEMEKELVGGGIPEETARYLAYSKRHKLGGNV